MAARALLFLAATAAAARPLPTIEGSFCCAQSDRLYDSSGTVVQQDNYTLCMDFDGAQWYVAASSRGRTWPES